MERMYDGKIDLKEWVFMKRTQLKIGWKDGECIGFYVYI